MHFVYTPDGVWVGPFPHLTDANLWAAEHGGYAYVQYAARRRGCNPSEAVPPDAYAKKMKEGEHERGKMHSVR